VQTITPSEMDKLLAAETDLVMIDVRTPAEFSELRTTRAKNVPLDTLRPKVLFESGDLRKDRSVYLICRTGGRAMKAAQKFAAQGFEQAVVVEGGTEAWAGAGLTVERSAPKAISLERQVRIGAGALVLLGLLLAYFVNPAFIGLSAFVGAGLIFAGITGWCGLGLLLAKFPWNR
jgi:rhodanese-related sulfurtransferase